MKYNNFRQKTVSVSDANKILALLEKFHIKMIFIDRNTSYNEGKLAIKDFNYSRYAIIKENDSTIYLETKYYEPNYKCTRYICNLNGDMKKYVRGLQCFNKLQQWCYRAPSVKEWRILEKYLNREGKYECSASPIIDYNRKYENMELYDIWEYDMNSAYSSIMLDRIPDLMHPNFNVVLKKNQVGFLIDNELTMIEKKGCYVQVAFDLIELTDKQKQYIYKLYEAKELAIDEDEHDALKTQLNAGIGYYQRYNPFMRAYIVHKCNDKINNIRDEDTVLWNTDAIFSRRRRVDLEIGNDIGQFKEIHIKRFAYIGNNYQTDYDLPKYRGIPKAWFPEHWDILKDEIPERCNMYKFENNRIVINKEYVNGKKIN